MDSSGSAATAAAEAQKTPLMTSKSLKEEPTNVSAHSKERRQRQKLILCVMIGVSALGLALMIAIVANSSSSSSSDTSSSEDLFEDPSSSKTLAAQQLKLQEPPTASDIILGDISSDEMMDSALPNEGTIRQSPHDKREYKYFTLSNGLKVTIVSDSETAKAAAAMDVYVGCMSDPENIPGIAHLLEHMLFMGSEKYPQENALEDLLARHGGSSNAFTSLEETVYYFDIEPNQLQDALDVWSQVFVSPLLSADSLSREVHAVNAEHTKNIENDDWRAEQLIKTTSSAAHPYHKFCTGDLNTLWTGPNEMGVDLHREILMFYEDHYSSNLMRLVIVGREPLSALEAMVRKNFEGVPNEGRARVSYDAAPVREPNQLGLLYEVVPRKERQVVNFLWILPSVHQHYKTKPLEYASHLLGHEGPGTLMSELKRRGWADGIVSGVTDKGPDFTWFQVEIALSNKGLDKVEAIAMLLYRYLGLIKAEGPMQWRWDEMRLVADAEFQFMERGEPAEYVTELAQSMQLYPVENVITGASLFEAWDESVVAATLSKLTPTRMIVLVESPKFDFSNEKSEDKTAVDLSENATTTSSKFRGRGRNADTLLPPEVLRRGLKPAEDIESVKVEHWYRTKYRERVLASDLISRLALPNLASDVSASNASTMRLPDRNPYIPTDFTIVTGEDDASAVDSNEDQRGNETSSSSSSSSSDDAMRPSAPILAIDQPCYRFWAYRDTHFQEPRISLFVRLDVPLPKDANALRVEATRMLVEELLVDTLAENMYVGHVAGMSYRVSMGLRSFELEVNGFSHKMTPFVRDLVDNIVHFRVNPERLPVVLDAMRRSLKDFDSEEPFMQGKTVSSVASHVDSYLPVEVLRTTLDLDLSAGALQAEISNMFTKGNLEVLLHGNLDSETQTNIAKILSDGFAPPTEASSCPRITRRVREFPKAGELALPFRVPNKRAKNSAVFNVYQIGPQTIQEDVKSELLRAILHEPMFDQLRTKEQLGYIVATKIERRYGVQSLVFVVQSPSKSADALNKRVDDFLTDFESSDLKTLSSATLQSHIAALATEKLAPFKTALEEATFMWSEIDSRQYRFDRRLLEVEALRKVTKEEIQALFVSTIRGESRRKLSVQIFGKDHTSNATLTQQPEAIAEKVQKSVKALPLYAAQKQRNPHIARGSKVRAA